MSDVRPENEKLQASNFELPQNRKRRITDSLCLLLLAASWFGMTMLGLVVTGAIKSDQLKAGDPARLINAIDYEGRICGVNSAVENSPNAYYLVGGNVICQRSCPSADAYAYTNAICKDSVTVTSDTQLLTAIAAGDCMVRMKTTKSLNRCVPDDSKSEIISKLSVEYSSQPTLLATAVSAIENSYSGYGDGKGALEGLVADMWTSAPVVFGFGFGFSLVLGFAYLFLLRLPGFLTILIWTIFASIFVIFLAGGVILQTTADQWADEKPQVHSDGSIDGMRYGAYACFAFAVLWLFFMIYFRKRVALAIGVVKEAARSISNMASLTLFPIFQVIAIASFLLPWLYYTVYLFSSGEVKTSSKTVGSNTVTVRSMSYNENTRYAFLLLLFCFFWTSQFIIAIGQLVVSLSVSFWYFTRDKAKDTGASTVLSAFRKASVFHLGTAAYGSLLIAIVKTIRAVVTYIQKKAKNSKSKLVEMILCCIQCCLYCIEKILKFINKNAYIQTALFGYSFCKAAREAFFLVARNIARVAALSIVGDFVLLLGKLVITLGTGFFAYFALSSQAEDLNGLIGILIVIVILAYFVACMFNEVFGMAIATILQCFIADEEMFEGKERYADGSLAKMVDEAIVLQAQEEKAAKVSPEEE